MIPRASVPTHETGDSFGIDILAVDAECRLLPSCRAFLLFANHQVHFLGLDILANMPCGQSIFILLFSAGEKVSLSYVVQSISRREKAYGQIKSKAWVKMGEIIS